MNDTKKAYKRATVKMNGSKWIRQDKRLAIYIRDALSCAYCGAGIEDENVSLTLDHIVPRSDANSTNHESNLITCCSRCNSVRQDRDVREFAQSVAAYVDDGRTANSILSFIFEQTQTELAFYRKEAKSMIERRGSYSNAIAQTKEELTK